MNLDKVILYLNNRFDGAGNELLTNRITSMDRLEELCDRDTTVSFVIDASFSWADTPQGYQYWRDINHRTKNINIRDLTITERNPYRQVVGGI